jgi:hypothetical protein
MCRPADDMSRKGQDRQNNDQMDEGAGDPSHKNSEHPKDEKKDGENQEHGAETYQGRLAAQGRRVMLQGLIFGEFLAIT